MKLTTKQKWIVAAIVLILLGIGGYLIWAHMHPPQPVTYESQQQAETPQGIERAADNAGVIISTRQATDVAQQIENIVVENKAPDKIVETTGAELASVVKSEQQKSGADFSIITNPKEPNKQVDTKELAKNNPAISLNQYNIKAYPDKLIEGTYYNSDDYDIGYMSKVKILGKQGYVGPVIQSEDKNIRVGVRVSVPL
ncbi:MAG: hypothetical protein LLG02_14070 [Pelosinus sp.]|nr:hypothetical protein [Pelosinus sp.]